MGGSGGGASTLEELERLGQMKEKGLLTDKEFEEMKVCCHFAWLLLVAQSKHAFCCPYLFAIQL